MPCAKPTVDPLKVPVYRCFLVREGSHQVADRLCTHPAAVAAILREYLTGADREMVVVLLLNTRKKLVGIHTAGMGTVDEAIVHPREVFKSAILAGAKAIIAGHNHPGGDPTPSPEDIAITQRLREAGRLLGIELLDHVIIGEAERYCSLAERGLLNR
jgi:DNA repair protein RadC